MLLPLMFLLSAVAVAIFLHTPSFGRLPRGARLERIRKSPNYVDGVFRYPVKTEVMTGSKSGLRTMWEFITEKRKDTKPSQPVPSEKADLTALAGVDDCIVWFGHSSYLLQVEGRRFLVQGRARSLGEPPVSWNRPLEAGGHAAMRLAGHHPRSLGPSGLPGRKRTPGNRQRCASAAGGGRALRAMGISRRNAHGT